MRRKPASESRFLDSEKIAPNILQLELNQELDTTLIWLMEEFDEQFDNSMSPSEDSCYSDVKTVAMNLLTYFRRSFEDDDENTQEIAAIGIEQLKTRFPDLFD